MILLFPLLVLLSLICSLFLLASPVLGAVTIQAQLEPRSDASKPHAANLSRLDEWQWTTSAQFGSNHQNVTLQLNFGSSWIALRSVFEGCNIDISVANQYTNVSGTWDHTCVFRAPYEVQFLLSFSSSFENSTRSLVFLDLVAIGGAQVANAQFLMGTKRTNSVGLALPNSGIAYGGSPKSYHENFVQQLHRQHSIESSVLSMWFDTRNGTKNAQLVAGGIDKSKYTGELYRMPIVNSYDPSLFSESPAIEVRMSSFASRKFNISMPIGVALYPDRPYSSLPRGLVDALGKAYGEKYDASVSTYRIDKKYARLKELLTFGFGRFNLSVPLNTLLSNYDTYQNSDQVCLSIRNVSTESWLGLDVLKHAFIAIDYDNREVRLAQGATSPGISLEIATASSGLAALPSAYAPNDTSLAIHYYVSTTLFLGSTMPVEVASTSWTGTSSGGTGSRRPFHALLCLVGGLLLGM